MSSLLKFRFCGAVLLVSFILLFTGCTRSQSPSQSSQSQNSSGKPRVLNLATWPNYSNSDLIQEFEKSTGITVKISNYGSNEELLAKLQAGASGYDLALPSDYMVFVLSKLNLIHPLDYSRLTQFKHLDSRMLKKSYDPENKYSLPLAWGTTGIAIQRTLYKGPLRGWNDLFQSESLKGKFSILDDMREGIGAALKSLGFSLNSRDPDQLKKAKELLLKIRPRIKAFISEPMMPLINGDVTVAHSFSTDAFQARKRASGAIDYILPVEGGTFWIDNLVIPVGVQNLAEAYTFINFILTPKNNAVLASQLFVAPASGEAFSYLPPDLRKNVTMYPPESKLSQFEMIEDLGDALSAWDRIWTEIKAVQD